VELEFVKKKLPSSPAEKRLWIEPGHRKLSIEEQCDLLELPRSPHPLRSSVQSS
jgi:hypothetical protein